MLASSTEKLLTIISLKASLSSTDKVRVLKITSLVPATFCTCTLESPVISSIFGTILASMSASDISSEKFTFVDVPPRNSSEKLSAPFPDALLTPIHTNPATITANDAAIKMFFLVRKFTSFLSLAFP